MFGPITKTLKIWTFVFFVTGLLLGSGQSSFAEPYMVGHYEMQIDTKERYDDEIVMFNAMLSVFSAAYLASGGNLEIVALDRDTICISDSGGCSSNASSQSRRVVMDVESDDEGMIIFSTHDQ